jgi:YidC/Oxa1 family membrane protein insertase
MNSLSRFFTAIFVQPIFNVLVWLYDVLPGNDVGLAIILLTIIVKVILYPFTVAQIKQQRALQELQPKIDEIRSRLKDSKEEQGRELMALYAREKVNPASSCLPLLIQLPVFIGLYQALTLGLKSQNFHLLYSFVPTPQSIDPTFLGFIDLSRPNYVLAIAAALIQFIQTKQILKPPAATVSAPPPEVAKSAGAKDENIAAMMNKQMTYFMPIMTAVIGFTLPGGLTLYWLVMSLLTLLQQWWLFKKMPPKMNPQLSGPQR